MSGPQPRHASPDRLTRWWRSVSLRAKVTGVTVAVLVIGLLATGLGTMVFLRTTLLANLDSTLTQVAQSSIVSTLIDTTVGEDGALVFTPTTDNYGIAYSVALYDASGKLVATANGAEANEKPVFPSSFALDRAWPEQLKLFDLSGDHGGSFRATVVVTPLSGTNALYTQLVAISTTPTERVVATYLGIYTLLALVVVLAAAFLVRWAVTLTFRSLTQVERTAEQIAAGDFGLRLTDLEPESTEVGRLKRAINAMLGRIDGAITQRDATVRQMRRFIGDASHELRTPLVTVRGYAELYRMGAIPDAEATAQAMERIEKEAMRMTTMVEDLLHLARLDERRDIVLAPVDLRPIARDAAMDVRAAAPQRDVTMTDVSAGVRAVSRPAPLPQATPARRRGSVPTAAITLAARLRRRPRGEQGDSGEIAPIPVAAIAPVMPPVVMGEENSIRQVVANLLGNAQRYSADDAPIELRVGTDEELRIGWIEVVDHGEGVPPQIRDQIFQRFWRADTSRARDTGGSGLGLSIVASIVSALHGTVEVRDTEGGGATFRVSLPLAVDQDIAAHLMIETQPITRLDIELD
ncbi:cell wall metabolism sensor histidine kinase WalK [Microbacterium sp. SORGH_AS_0888]|uniref:sensor histidine kinase n=1 Tax=Microbacterium sp. SORGH_AS_0888 TaxID=3041791 RepID=UPI0027890729|nr:HAMP domain-containing sensor histidine kinase [Microbacterium sp. SORGH_AS_0888]MDQ1131096.1 two-component system OmpR family sensor kinase [Microbacterium sp. SORGH_AS_0888]